MVKDIEGSLLSRDAIDVSVLLVLIILGKGGLPLLVRQLQEDPSVLLVLLLHQTAVVHKYYDLPWASLSLFFSEQAAAEFVRPLRHTNRIAFLLNLSLFRQVRHYFRLLNI